MSKITEQLSSGCKPIDDLLGGGFEVGVVTQIYGEPGSGKTNLSLQLAVECVKNGKKVIYWTLKLSHPTGSDRLLERMRKR
ncbi:MAG: ATPase domain-containing protein [Methanolobus sp.]